MTGSPTITIYSYTRSGDNFYLHIPKRLTGAYNLASGARFIGFLRDGRIIIEQEISYLHKEELDAA